MRRSKPIRRSGYLKRKPAKRLARRSATAPYLALIRQQACIACAKPGPSDAAHVATGMGQKGAGLKVPDDQSVPLCRSCHRDFDTGSGRFKAWPREHRHELASRWVALTRLQLGTLEAA